MKTTIDHTLRQKMGITCDEYAVLDYFIHKGLNDLEPLVKMGFKWSYIAETVISFTDKGIFIKGETEDHHIIPESTLRLFKSDNGDQIDQVINHLNLLTASKFSLTKKDSRKAINDRINEGHSLADFEKVIIFKYNEWKNTDQEQYLRPVTLFGNKFEGYLQGALKSLPKPSENPRMEGMVM